MIHRLSDGPDLQLSGRLVYKGLVQFGELTTSELVQHTGGSQSSVYRILCSLVDQGLVLQSAAPRSGNGRRPIAYRINPEAGYVLGAYLRWDVFGVGLCTMDGALVACRRWSLGEGTTPTDLVRTVADSAAELLRESGVDRARVVGLGFATTGPLLREKGILFHPHHIVCPNWEVVPIRDLLEMVTGCHVVVNTLASTALLGELMQRRQGLTGRSSYVLLDLGVGTDTFLPGTVDKSVDDRSGTLGSMIIDYRDPRGSLASYASVDGIIDRLTQAVPSLAGAVSVPPDFSPEELWRSEGRLVALRRAVDKLGRPAALRARRALAGVSAALGAGISNFVALLNPRVVFYGGRVATHFPELVRDALDYAVTHRPAGMVSPVEFLESQLVDELLIRGAVYQVLDEHIGLLIPVSFERTKASAAG